MMSPDRFPDIKRQVAELDAAGRLSDTSPLRWLVGEVERLRGLPHTLPLDEIRLLAQCADQGAPSLARASETVQAWLVELVGGPIPGSGYKEPAND